MPVLEGKGDAKYQHQLPTVSFRVITDDKSLLAPAGVHSVSKRVSSPRDGECRHVTDREQEQSRHFGCERVALIMRDALIQPDNDFSDFERPEHYIRYIGGSRASVWRAMAS
jgi:NuA3 HAT complex component NTO1